MVVAEAVWATALAAVTVSWLVRLVGLVQAWRWALGRMFPTPTAAAAATAVWPGVSVLKPVMDVHLIPVADLESFFALDYPEYELLFCAQTAQEAPALYALCERYGHLRHVHTRVFVGSAPVGPNPKIENMAAAFAAARFDLLWVADASLLAHPLDLQRLVLQAQHTTGLVHQLPLAGSCTTLADRVEHVFFATQHARFYLTFALLRLNCVNGMSMLVRRSVLESVGGLAAFSAFVAEDFFIGQALHTHGHLPVLAAGPALQFRPLGQTLRDVYLRQVRWTRLRKIMLAVPTAAEVFTETISVGLLAMYVWPAASAAVVFVCNALFACATDYAMVVLLRPLGTARLSLAAFLPAWVLRETGTFVRYVHAVSGSTVAWGGRVFQLHSDGTASRLGA